MKRDWHLALAIFIVSLVGAVLVAALPAKSARAAVAAAQVTSMTVTGPDGKVITSEPLRAGAVYTIDFSVKVAAGINDTMSLKTDLVRSPNSDHFWSLKSDYAGIDTATWQPGLPELDFEAVAGDFHMQLIGQVPADYVSTTLENGDVVHVAKDITLVGLYLGSGTTIEENKLEVIDNEIGAYRQSLDSANAMLKNTKADPQYAGLVSGIVSEAKALGDAGYIKEAVALLAVIPAAGDWIAPRGSTSFMWVIIGVLAVLAVLFLFMLIRMRGAFGLVKSQADEQAKRLELLSARATRIGDGTLAGDISKVKSDLEDLARR